MNEINISIPYSLFKGMIYCFVQHHFITTKGTALFAIEQVKEYWILLDSEIRDDVIQLCDSPNNAKLAKEEIQNFKEWAIKNRDAKHEINISRPLLAMLPLIDPNRMKKSK